MVANIVGNPGEQKFRKVSLASNVFKSKIDEVFGAKNALDGVGFVEEDGFYIYKGDDMGVLQQAIALTQKELEGL